MWVAKKCLLVILFIAISVPFSSCGRVENGIKEEAISPCVLASKPFKYSNQKIKLTGFVESTREGAYVWDDGCENSGIALHIRNTLQTDTDFSKLLSQRMSSSHPKTTLAGTFRYTRWGSVGAVIFGKKSFEAERVLDMQVAPSESTTAP
jgi:hypothetical protein